MRGSRYLVVALVVGSGCLARSQLREPPPEVVLAPPTITKLSVACELDADRWTLFLETDGWVGEASAVSTIDAAYLEAHRFVSVGYERDGSFERLRLRLPIVTDFRAATDGSTAFTCADDVDRLITVTDLDGAVTDCRVLGPRPDRWASLPDTGDCTTLWTATTP